MAADDKGLRPTPSDRRSDEHIQKYPVCGMPMSAIAGSRSAQCGNRGYKESCC